MWLAAIGKVFVFVVTVMPRMLHSAEGIYDLCTWTFFSAGGALALLVATYGVRNLFGREQACSRN